MSDVSVRLSLQVAERDALLWAIDQVIDSPAEISDERYAALKSARTALQFARGERP